MTNEEISLNTKRALSSALKNAMEKKPLSKITITELITACNVNRKTFYYHFQDIYDLVKWMFEEEAIEILKQFDLITDTENAFRFIMNYIENNNHIINCAYDSLGYENLRHFLYKETNSIIRNTIENGEKTLNLSIDTAFKDFVADFYTEAAVGITINWIKNRFTQDNETVLQDILLICRTSIPEILKAKAKQETSYKKED